MLEVEFAEREGSEESASSSFLWYVLQNSSEHVIFAGEKVGNYVMRFWVKEACVSSFWSTCVIVCKIECYI